MKLKKLKIGKTTKIVVLAVLVMLVVDLYVLKHIRLQRTLTTDGLQTYSKGELAKYDGTDPNVATLLAMDGFVYDISAGRDNFYAPGEAYHDLAGKDASKLLQLFGGDIIRKKYKIVGVYIP